MKLWVKLNNFIFLFFKSMAVFMAQAFLKTLRLNLDLAKNLFKSSNRIKQVPQGVVIIEMQSNI